MQKRNTTGINRAAVVRAALHAFPGNALLGNAPGDGAGKGTARTATRNSKVHLGERRNSRACGHPRPASDRRPEGTHLEHFFDTHEPARESRSREHAQLFWAHQPSALKNFPPS